jgi:hypothetical protein
MDMNVLRFLRPQINHSHIAATSTRSGYYFPPHIETHDFGVCGFFAVSKELKRGRSALPISDIATVS